MTTNPLHSNLASLLALLVLTGCASLPETGEGPFQATGVKVGEVTHNSAIIWTRSTRRDQPGLPLEDIDNWQRSVDLTDLKSLFNPGDLGDLAMEPVMGGDEQIDEKLTREQKRALVAKHAVPGQDADIQLVYRPTDRTGPALTTKRLSARNFRDFTRQFQLTDLLPDTTYEVISKIFPEGAAEPSSTLDFSFRTAPAPEEARRVAFTVVTGQAYRNVDQMDTGIYSDIEGVEEAAEDYVIFGHKIYATMLTFAPHFMINTGDVVYYDHQGASATSKRMARVWWQRMFALPNMRGFNRKVPVYYMKDDHDTLKNDCEPGQRHGSLSYAEGRGIFHEQTPFPVDNAGMSLNRGRPYRTVRWGKDLQVWMLETRDYRSPNTMDYTDPKKTMLGAKQVEWLDKTLGASDATFKIVVFAVPFIGPDRPETAAQEEKDNLGGVVSFFRPPRIDNLANDAWHLERERLLELLSKHKNIIVLCGDRHWKYHSAWPSRFDPKIHEFACGSTSDKHARSLLRMYGVPTPKTSDLLYWRDEVEQGGFLSVVVEPAKGNSQPVAIFRFHKVDGSPAYPANTRGNPDIRIYADGTTVARRTNL